MKIRYYGHVGSFSGYGRAAADLCMSLLATGKIDLEIRPLGWDDAEAKLALEGSRARLRDCIRGDAGLTEPDAVIVHTLPMDCAKVQDLVCIQTGHPVGRATDKPWIAYTTWEAISPIPETMAASLDAFAQIWTPSTVSASAFGADGTVYAIPHAFDPGTLEIRRAPSIDAPSIDDVERFRFYWIGAWTSRKNPAGILRAWAMAFGPNDPVELYMHSPGAQEPFAIALHQTGLTAHEMAPVKLSQYARDDAWLWGLHAMSDCFVTATRGEAFNLPAFDAMLAGRMVIAPGRQGSDDFLGRTDARLYNGFPTPAGVDVRVTEHVDNGIKMQVVGAQGLTSRSVWREPDLCELAQHMKRVSRDRSRNLSYGYDPVATYSYNAVGKLALSALEDL